MIKNRSEMTYIKPTIADHPIFLWFKQYTRKLTGKAFLQEEVLEMLVNHAREDENLLGVLLFGSVVSNTHTWKSDIDIVYVYNTHEPVSGLVKYFLAGVVIDKFYATLENLKENQQTVPYLLHMFSEGKIIFDRDGSVTPIVDGLRQYFAQHPEIQEEWLRIKELHQVEKKGPQCGQVTIIDRWNQLEEKYSNGLRKRTFFNI
jgi:predicted nucleotidyltransferase